MAELITDPGAKVLGKLKKNGDKSPEESKMGVSGSIGSGVLVVLAIILWAYLRRRNMRRKFVRIFKVSPENEKVIVQLIVGEEMGRLWCSLTEFKKVRNIILAPYQKGQKSPRGFSGDLEELASLKLDEKTAQKEYLVAEATAKYYGFNN